MSQPTRLFIPALGRIYGTLAPVTEPLIRVVAGGSLAVHGYPILFGNIGVAAKFFESAGFENGLFWAYVVGAVEFVCGLFLAIGFLTRVVADHRFSRRRHRHLSLAVRLRLGKPRYRISAVLVDRGVAFPRARWWGMVARRNDRPGGVTP